MVDWISLVAPTLAAAGGALAALALARVGARRAVTRPGWIAVGPGVAHRLGLVLGGALLGLTLRARLTLDATQAEAAFRMSLLNVLLAAFAICVAICVWQVRRIYRAGVHWRDDAVAVDAPDGTLLLHALDSVVTLGRSANGSATVHFADGSHLTLDLLASGVRGLVKRIAEIQG